MLPHKIKTLEKLKVSLLGQTSSQYLAKRPTDDGVKGRTFVRFESVEKGHCEGSDRSIHGIPVKQ